LSAAASATAVVSDPPVQRGDVPLLVDSWKPATTAISFLRRLFAKVGVVHAADAGVGEGGVGQDAHLMTEKLRAFPSALVASASSPTVTCSPWRHHVLLALAGASSRCRW